jgi:hypothetical protein
MRFAYLFLIFWAIPALASQTPFGDARFSKLRIGMSEADTVAALGNPTKVIKNRKIWTDENAEIEIRFDAGKLISATLLFNTPQPTKFDKKDKFVEYKIRPEQDFARGEKFISLPIEGKSWRVDPKGDLRGLRLEKPWK